jgi:hypothetical protein
VDGGSVLGAAPPAGDGGGGGVSVAGTDGGDGDRGGVGVGGTGVVTSEGTVGGAVEGAVVVVVPCMLLPPHCLEGVVNVWPETIDCPEVYGA